jgi:hypothetical protein
MTFLTPLVTGPQSSREQDSNVDNALERSEWSEALYIP